jgi:hypothetical protein
MQSRYSRLKATAFAIAVFIRNNPHMLLAVLLFVIGVAVLSTAKSALSGALFGAGASLLGAWITELNKRRSDTIDKTRREADARRYLSSELNRTIERILTIHQRATVNFTASSNKNWSKPNDVREDFIPYMPVLYPRAAQFRDLSGDDATALIAFYDSLLALAKFVDDWWEREGQLSVNIFNMILTLADDSLARAEDGIQRFQLEKRFPPRHESLAPLSSRVKQSMLNAKQARDTHIERNKAKPATSSP